MKITEAERRDNSVTENHSGPSISDNTSTTSGQGDEKVNTVSLLKRSEHETWITDPERPNEGIYMDQLGVRF
ncbi:hypothetical protein ACOMHN_040848 [Nucella lapillus]